jgi:hypothetical protein
MFTFEPNEKGKSHSKSIGGNMSSYFEVIANALMVGFGSALGSYLANKTLIKRLEKIVEETKEKTKKK